MEGNNLDDIIASFKEQRSSVAGKEETDADEDYVDPSEYEVDDEDLRKINE